MNILIERRTNRTFEKVAAIENLAEGTELPGLVGQVIGLAFDQFNSEPELKQVEFAFKGQTFRATLH